jgi:hypothetical protein
MPKVAKTLMGIFAEDVLWDQEEEEARMQQEKAAQEQVGVLLARTMLHSIALGSSHTRPQVLTMNALADSLAACARMQVVQNRNGAGKKSSESAKPSSQPPARFVLSVPCARYGTACARRVCGRPCCIDR